MGLAFSFEVRATTHLIRGKKSGLGSRGRETKKLEESWNSNSLGKGKWRKSPTNFGFFPKLSKLVSKKNSVEMNNDSIISVCSLLNFSRGQSGE